MDDPNANRKNLVVTSLMFILYYLGGGIFEGSINLQVINLKFQNAWALAVIAWIALIWFWIRFKQTHPFNFVRYFNESYKSLRTSWALIRYVSMVTGLKHRPEAGLGFTIDTTGIEKRKMVVKLDSWLDGRNTGQDFVGLKLAYDNNVDITLAWCGLLPLWLVISATIKHEGIGSFVVPHAMFYFAVFLGIKNTILPNVIILIKQLPS